jgi:hypothetical protein
MTCSFGKWEKGETHRLEKVADSRSSGGFRDPTIAAEKSNSDKGLESRANNITAENSNSDKELK